jgi:Uma2 family endonuclease
MSVVFDRIPKSLPDHTQLPDSDGQPVENFNEHPQSILLTDSIWPVLCDRHPDGQFAIGQNSGIYWRLTDPPLNGCKAPDWFYVPGVPPLLVHGQPRRSYVLWQEIIPPLIILEFVSGDGSEERDTTPWEGKFWVYERAIRPAFYGIYEVIPGRVEMHHLIEGRFVPMEPNVRGHFEIPQMGVELGLWHGQFMNLEFPWLRFWDLQGNMLPISEERAEQERQRAEQERQRAEQERQRAEQERQRAEQERQRAEHARQRSERLAQQLRTLGVEPSNGP